MNRKRIVAKLAAASLLFSGLPVTSVCAVEPLADTAQEAGEGQISAPDSAGNAPEDTLQTENETSEGQEKEEASTDSAKMAGTDGILYDGVAYLSESNVLAMEEEMQEVYRGLCDDIAISRDSGLQMEDVVLAVDAEGDLYCSYYVPMRTLETMQEELLPGAESIPNPTAEENVFDDKETAQGEEIKTGEASASDQNAADGEINAGSVLTSEPDVAGGIPADNPDTAGGETEEEEAAPDGKNTADGKIPAGNSDTADGKTSTDDQNAVDRQPSDGDIPADDQNASDAEATTDETIPDGQNTAGEETPADEAAGDNPDNRTQETAPDGLDVTSEVTPGREIPAADQNDTEAPYTLSAENMERIVEPTEKTFAAAVPVKVAHTTDLGYGLSAGAADTDWDMGAGAGGAQLYSVLPKDNYFEAQLTSAQKKYYKAAKEKLTAGSNQFSFQAALSEKEAATSDVAHAVSALILACPEQTDWIAKPGGFQGHISYKKGAKKGTYTFTFDVSPYYSWELDTQANNKVQEIGGQALSYAEANYPDAPVYGIVKYYDQWLCENGYYENAAAKETPADAEKEMYYQCHSAYGILLNGHGVCESYSKTMARLLDAVGIPNLYVVGAAGGGGHTWNYIQMPDGDWYLQDSTWNDTADPAHTVSDGTYFLKKQDGSHRATGCNYDGESPDFTFPSISGSDYSYEAFRLNESECSLVAKETVTLSPARSTDGFWTSSDTKVAKVDKNGKVTAVSGGTAVITFAGRGLTADCAVDVDQVKSLKTADTKKTSGEISLGIAETQKESRDIELDVDMGASPHTAQWLVERNKIPAPEVLSSKPDVAAVTAAVTDNTVTVHVQAAGPGTSNITVKFSGKTVKIKASAGKLVTREMFDITWPVNVTGEDGGKTVAYTGKAVKPTVTKKADEAYKPVKFKVAYVNNTNAGNAKVVVTGAGEYGGTIEYPFTITPVDITGADFSKALKSKPYDGGDNPPAAVVKLGKQTLKRNRDYELLYTGGGFDKEKPKILPAGSYTVTVRGIGNYTGEARTTQTYQVTQNTIAKVKVSGPGSVKHTGVPQNICTVMIGKNALPSSDYDIVWYLGQGKTKRDTPMTIAPIAKGKYTAVITVKGDNLTTTAKKTEIVKKLTVK